MKRRWSLSTLPLRTRVFALTLGIAGLGVTLGASLLLTSHRQTLRDIARRDADGLAATVAEYAEGALAFDDRDGAADILNRLSANQNVRSAALFDVQGKPFAAFGRSDDQHIQAAHTVVHAGRVIGTLKLSVSADRLERQLERDTLGAIALCVLLLAISAAATARVQRLVTDPILELLASMRRVGHDNRLDERIPVRRDDEVGSLYRGFNTMLDQLRERAIERDQSEARLRALMRALPDLVYVMDEQQRFTEVLCRHAGLLPEGGTAGSRVQDTLGEEASERLRIAVQGALEKHEPRHFDYTIQRGRASFFAEATVSPLPLRDDKNARLLLVVVRDLSERRDLEQRLLQSQKLDAVGQLAGGIAHDFNNLLAGILGFAELIRDGSAGLDRTFMAGEIIRVAEQAAQLTSRLLGFARRSKTQSVPSELNQLIVRVGSILERTIDRSITMQLEQSPTPCWVKADSAQLESAVLNLALNARDAMPNGGVLSIAVQRAELRARDIARTTLAPGQDPPAPGPFIQLLVRDTGTGIDASLRDKIFEPFFTTKDVGKGSGLGLAAVLGAARAHHGLLALDTELGKGTTFTLSLPELTGAQASEQALPPERHLRASREARILLVDDNDAVGNAGRLLLEDAGYTVVLAASGREALEVLARDPRSFNLLIMDMIMPEMGGREAIARARALSPELPILIVSGYSGALEGEVEADGFLHKPYTRRDLTQQVALLLEGPAG